MQVESYEARRPESSRDGTHASGVLAILVAVRKRARLRRAYPKVILITTNFVRKLVS
ncbi:MAG TPA: hypothetical protein VLN44_06840 [Pyrinomonadaceae bacterium]|nr:hypothetical protein [Pyrinomonadaceae bacterium]